MKTKCLVVFARKASIIAARTSFDPALTLVRADKAPPIDSIEGAQAGLRFCVTQFGLEIESFSLSEHAVLAHEALRAIVKVMTYRFHVGLVLTDDDETFTEKEIRSWAARSEYKQVWYDLLAWMEGRGDDIQQMWWSSHLPPIKAAVMQPVGSCNRPQD